MLDKIAEKQTSAYINYTYYQTYEWNNFLSHHSTDGLGKMTTAMRLRFSNGRRQAFCYNSFCCNSLV